MKEELRKELVELEKKERDVISSIRQEFEYLRERICVASGGHFFYPPKKVLTQMLFGYREDVIEICEVCNYKHIIETERVL